MQKGFVNIAIVFGLVLIVAVVGYFVLISKQNTNPTADNQGQTDNSDQKSQVSYDNWATYKNSRHGFEVKYPSGFEIREGKIEPNTYFVAWENPNYSNSKVNIIYLNEGKAALTQSELSKGSQVKVGQKDGLKFTIASGNPLYWVDIGSYALAIYFERPKGAGSNYNEYIDISSFKF